jgi:hypothetical protein
MEFLRFAAIFIVPSIAMVVILMLLDLIVLRWQKWRNSPSY